MPGSFARPYRRFLSWDNLAICAHRDAADLLVGAEGAAVHDDHVHGLVLRVVHQQLKVLVPPACSQG